MNEFLKVLLNIRSLRATCRELTLEQLEEGLEKLSAVVAERQQDESAERQAREEHQKKIAEYAEMLKAAGIDPAELVTTAAIDSPKASKGKRAVISIMAWKRPGPARVACPPSLPRPWPKASPWKTLPSERKCPSPPNKKPRQARFFIARVCPSAPLCGLNPEHFRDALRDQQISGHREKPVT